MTTHHSTSKKAFTLIEVLFVIALLSILIAVTLAAINPARHFAQSRNSERVTDVYAILIALHQYAANNNGNFPTGLTTENKEICATGITDCTDLYDLSDLTDDLQYLVSIPIDPGCDSGITACHANGTGYWLQATSSGRVSVTSPGAELSQIITAVR